MILHQHAVKRENKLDRWSNNVHDLPTTQDKHVDVNFSFYTSSDGYALSSLSSSSLSSASSAPAPLLPPLALPPHNYLFLPQGGLAGSAHDNGWHDTCAQRRPRMHDAMNLKSMSTLPHVPPKILCFACFFFACNMFPTCFVMILPFTPTNV